MKNIVKRQCRSCREIKNRDELIKITSSNDSLFINPDSKIFGRSVYVCKNEECIKNFIKIKGIKRGLKCNNEAQIKEIEEKLKTILLS
jgi:predicted RNA-binding protein YlxR (DUF448 family)